MTSDATPLSDTADFPADWPDAEIHRIANLDTGNDASVLLHLRFACGEWRRERARARELEAERDHLRGMVTECEAALLECRHEDEEITKLQRQVEAARTAMRTAMDNIGVPSDDYPAAVAYAYDVLDAALAPQPARTEGPQ